MVQRNAAVEVGSWEEVIGSVELVVVHGSALVAIVVWVSYSV